MTVEKLLVEGTFTKAFSEETLVATKRWRDRWVRLRSPDRIYVGRVAVVQPTGFWTRVVLQDVDERYNDKVKHPLLNAWKIDEIEFRVDVEAEMEVLTDDEIAFEKMMRSL